MTENVRTQRQPKRQIHPFTDIINQQVQRICPEDQKDLVKHSRSYKEQLETDPPKEHFNNKADKDCHDRTIKKGASKDQGQIVTFKTIREELPQIFLDVSVNPEFDFLAGFGGEVFRIIDCLQDFNQIKKIFLEEGKKKKLLMSQNTQSFATVKKSSYASCKCIIKMWMSSQSDATVYQLRSSGKGGRRAKLILVEGQQSEFRRFTLEFLRKLMDKQMISLTNSEKVELFFSQNSTKIESHKKQCNKLISKGNKLKKQHQSQIQKLLLAVKQECQELKLKIQSQQLQYNSKVAVQLQDLCFKESNILSLYDLYFAKQYEHFQERRAFLLKKLNLFDIFKHLEISEHYNQFRRRRDSLRGSNKSIENLPYMPAIKCLQSIQKVNAPHAIMQKLLLFQQKIKSCHNDYFINMIKISDMDDYLPITIFCILAMDNEQTNLLSLTSMLLSYLGQESEYEWEKKILTNIEAAFDFISKEWPIEA